MFKSRNLLEVEDQDDWQDWQNNQISNDYYEDDYYPVECVNGYIPEGTNDCICYPGWADGNNRCDVDTGENKTLIKQMENHNEPKEPEDTKKETDKDNDFNLPLSLGLGLGILLLLLLLCLIKHEYNKLKKKLQEKESASDDKKNDNVDINSKSREKEYKDTIPFEDLQSNEKSIASTESG